MHLGCCCCQFFYYWWLLPILARVCLPSPDLWIQHTTSITGHLLSFRALTHVPTLCRRPQTQAQQAQAAMGGDGKAGEGNPLAGLVSIALHFCSIAVTCPCVHHISSTWIMIVLEAKRVTSASGRSITVENIKHPRSSLSGDLDK